MTFDVIIIGSGPGGYVCAIRAAQLGLKTAIVEKDKTLGGTCLNVGCIPSKALLESSELLNFLQHSAEGHGLTLQNASFDLGKMMSRKEKIVKDLTQGVAFLMKKNKIEVFKGLGKIVSPGIVDVQGEAGNVQLQTKNIVIATGSVPTELPFLKFDEKKIVSSTGALSLQGVPKEMVVVGGGVIGLELGSVWLRLGSKVTIVEFTNQLAGGMDQQCVQVLQKILTKQGMKFMLETKVTGSQKKGYQIELSFENRNDQSTGKLVADVVLVSTGRKPFTEGLGLENVGVTLDKQGRVEVNTHFATSAPGIYAIGDVIRGPMLAHKAEEEGVAIAEMLAGHAGHVNYDTVPGVLYTHPEVAGVGLTEEQCKAQGLDYRVGTFPFIANGRAKALGDTDGLVKIIADAKTDRILGGHIVGPRASELLGEIVICMEFGGSSEDLARSFHAHPTLNEVVREAALGVEKRIRQM